MCSMPCDILKKTYTTKRNFDLKIKRSKAEVMQT